MPRDHPATERPEVVISPHCSDPYDCALKDVCWSVVPDNSVFDLRRGGSEGVGLV